MASLGWLLNLGFGGSAETAVELGGTSQLGAVTSTGGITLERNLGATSQLGAYTSSGGITLEVVLGATSQLQGLSASGVIQVGDVTQAAVTTGASPRRRHRQFANIDGKLVEVSSFKEAERLINHFRKSKNKKPKVKKRRLTFNNGPYVSVYDADAMPQKKVKELLNVYHEDEDMLLLLLMAA